MTIEHVPCCVPQCGRRMSRSAWVKRYGTEPAPGAQFICARHWATVPKDMKRAYARVRRRERRFGVELNAAVRLWRRVKREAGAGPPLRVIATDRVDTPPAMKAEDTCEGTDE